MGNSNDDGTNSLLGYLPQLEVESLTALLDEYKTKHTWFIDYAFNSFKLD